MNDGDTNNSYLKLDKELSGFKILSAPIELLK